MISTTYSGLFQFKTKYGILNNELDFAVSSGLLDPKFRDFRQKYIAGFDIESLETPIKERSEAVHEVSIQTVVSISVATNIPGFETKHFCRASMSPSDGTLLITEFMDHLHGLAEALQELIPPEIRALTEKLEVELKGKTFCKSKTKMMKLLNYLKSFRTLNIFGFNSGEFLSKHFHYEPNGFFPPIQALSE